MTVRSGRLGRYFRERKDTGIDEGLAGFSRRARTFKLSRPPSECPGEGLGRMELQYSLRPSSVVDDSESS